MGEWAVSAGSRPAPGGSYRRASDWLTATTQHSIAVTALSGVHSLHLLYLRDRANLPITLTTSDIGLRRSFSSEIYCTICK